jgi:hypothetical protein
LVAGWVAAAAVAGLLGGGAAPVLLGLQTQLPAAGPMDELVRERGQFIGLCPLVSCLSFSQLTNGAASSRASCVLLQIPTTS